MSGRRQHSPWFYLARYAYILLISTVFLCGPLMDHAAAVDCVAGLPQLDCLAELNDSTAWLPDLCGAAGAGSGSFGGSGAQPIFNYFTSRGYTPEQAAGIVGNTSAESANEPERLQGTSQGTLTPYNTIPAGSNLGWGITQWTPASKVGDFVSGNGLDPNQLTTQMNFLFQQLEGTSPVHSEKGAGDALKAVVSGITTSDNVAHDTAWHAAQVFLQYYERASDSSPDGNNARIRGSLADSALAAFGNSAPIGPDISNSGNGCNSTPVSGSGCVSTTGAGPFDDSKAPKLSIPSGDPIQNVATVCHRATELNGLADSSYQGAKLLNIATDWCYYPIFNANGGNRDRNTATGCWDARCDYTASFMWGYQNSGYGYASANNENPIAGLTYHWNDLVAQHKAHVVGADADAYSPPVGALLFYDNHIYGIGGHVTVYLGNNWTVSSDMNGSATYSPGRVGIVHVYDITTDPTTHHGWGETYLGWADPIIAGQPLSAQELAL